jgi:hypothetical protein
MTNEKRNYTLIGLILAVLAIVALYFVLYSDNQKKSYQNTKENYANLQTVILNRKPTTTTSDMELSQQNIGCNMSDPENVKCIYQFTINHPRTPTII